MDLSIPTFRQDSTDRPIGVNLTKRDLESRPGEKNTVECATLIRSSPKPVLGPWRIFLERSLLRASRMPSGLSVRSRIAYRQRTHALPSTTGSAKASRTCTFT
jgi:hypothetical protein